MKRPRREDDHEKAAGGDGNDEEHYACSSILRLPEACLAHAISLTTPVDACRSSAVSAAFRAAASSDAVWEGFLPLGYRSVLARADHPVDLTCSKMEVFLSLAQDHVLLDQRTKSFWLERTSGAKCYMLSSRSMSIIWGENPLYWRQVYLPDSRFEEVSELLAVCWLDIAGSIDREELSPNTKYAAYLVFNLAEESYGLDSPTQEASITVGDRLVSANRVVCLHPRDMEETPLTGGAEQAEEGRVSYPRERDDGWMEVELGEFYNDQQGSTGVVVVRLAEQVQLNWKKGLILEGVEITPKK
ncbi:hypothetical protein ACP4OV_020352 [Aristida adscensionis]